MRFGPLLLPIISITPFIIANCYPIIHSNFVPFVTNLCTSSSPSKDLTMETFETYLDTGDLLPIDLMVRTSNENRISNFLLWKLAYAELLFVPEHWPDMVKDENKWQYVLNEFAKRNRRFGGGKKADYCGKNQGKGK